MAKAPSTPEETAAVDRFRIEVCANSAAHDPNEELDWYALSYGFFVACGLSRDAAEEMALYTRYDVGYWQ